MAVIYEKTICITWSSVKALSLSQHRHRCIMQTMDRFAFWPSPFLSRSAFAERKAPGLGQKPQSLHDSCMPLNPRSMLATGRAK